MTRNAKELESTSDNNDKHPLAKLLKEGDFEEALGWLKGIAYSDSEAQSDTSSAPKPAPVNPLKQHLKKLLKTTHYINDRYIEQLFADIKQQIAKLENPPLQACCRILEIAQSMMLNLESSDAIKFPNAEYYNLAQQFKNNPALHTALLNLEFFIALPWLIASYNQQAQPHDKISPFVSELTNHQLAKLALLNPHIALYIFNDPKLWKELTLVDIKRIIITYHNYWYQTKNVDKEIYVALLEKIASAIAAFSYEELSARGFFNDENPLYLIALKKVVPNFELGNTAITEINAHGDTAEQAFLNINTLEVDINNNKSQKIKQQPAKKVFANQTAPTIGDKKAVSETAQILKEESLPYFTVTVIRIGKSHPQGNLLLTAVQCDAVFAKKTLASAVDQMGMIPEVKKGINRLAFTAMKHLANYKQQLARSSSVPKFFTAIFTAIMGLFSADYRVNTACDTLTLDQHAELLIKHSDLLRDADTNAMAKFAELDLPLQLRVIVHCKDGLPDQILKKITSNTEAFNKALQKFTPEQQTKLLALFPVKTKVEPVKPRTETEGPAVNRALAALGGKFHSAPTSMASQQAGIGVTYASPLTETVVKPNQLAPKPAPIDTTTPPKASNPPSPSL